MTAQHHIIELLDNPGGGEHGDNIPTSITDTLDALEAIIAHADRHRRWTDRHNTLYNTIYTYGDRGFGSRNIDRLITAAERHDHHISEGLLVHNWQHTHTPDSCNPLLWVNHLDIGIVDLVGDHGAPAAWCNAQQLSELAATATPTQLATIADLYEAVQTHERQLDANTWATLAANSADSRRAVILLSYHRWNHHFAAAYFKLNTQQLRGVIDAVARNQVGRNIIRTHLDELDVAAVNCAHLDWLVDVDTRTVWERVAPTIHGTVADAVEVVTTLTATT